WTMVLPCKRKVAPLTPKVMPQVQVHPALHVPLLMKTKKTVILTLMTHSVLPTWSTCLTLPPLMRSWAAVVQVPQHGPSLGKHSQPGKVHLDSCTLQDCSSEISMQQKLQNSPKSSESMKPLVVQPPLPLMPLPVSCTIQGWVRSTMGQPEWAWTSSACLSVHSSKSMESNGKSLIGALVKPSWDTRSWLTWLKQPKKTGLTVLQPNSTSSTFNT
ncbi:hypothetical protein GGI24_004297, partial [Coemansia furcata]